MGKKILIAVIYAIAISTLVTVLSNIFAVNDKMMFSISMVCSFIFGLILFRKK